VAADQRHIWWTPKAILLHCILAVCLPGFTTLFIWQVDRVREGNGLSWAYVFEWPFFIGYAIYLWWRLVHEQDEPTVSPTAAPPPATAPMEAAAPTSRATGAAPSHPEVGAAPTEEDEELAAYNAYLAELNASGRRKHW
jgi:hypothetical protein